MIYYISDTHFNDERVAALCGRPFKSIQEHDQALVNNWNKKVTNNDIVYFVGDICTNFFPGVIDLLKSLNGEKYLVVGNHDMDAIEEYKSSGIFKKVEYIMIIKDQGRDVILSHQPLMDWDTVIRGSYLIYGHIHNKTIKNGIEYQQIKDYYKNKKAYNAGVDVTNFEPVTLDELIKLKEINNGTYFN